MVADHIHDFRLFEAVDPLKAERTEEQLVATNISSIRSAFCLLGFGGQSGTAVAPGAIAIVQPLRIQSRQTKPQSKKKRAASNYEAAR